jgi:iron complex outermembrane receptor protein
MAGWDYSAAYSHSESEVKGNISGYPGALAVKALRLSGLLDPFVGPGSQSAAAQSAINGANYKGYWDGGLSQLDAINLNGSRPIGQLDGGAIMLGLGANFNSEKFQSKPSLFAQGKLANPVTGVLCDPANGLACDTRFGDASTTPPYSASRTSTGLFGELVFPVSKALELGAGIRTDNYSDFGAATTGKASFRFSPSSQWMMRGSVGTGFHAPTVPQVNAALRDYGVTSDKYTCTPALLAMATSLGAVCQSGNRQYDQMASGNPALTPEKSIQSTLGVRFEPNDSMTFGVDLWQVNISDSFGQLTEQLVFSNPAAYAKSWTSKKDIGTGKTYLAFLADNKNLGNSTAQGLDFDIQARAKTSMGAINSQLTVTYMLRDEAQLVKDGPYYSSIGNFAQLGGVSFKSKGRWATTLKTGDWSHTVGMNFQSGYDDQLTKVDVLDATGNITGTEDIRMKVDAYFTYDWQTVWMPSKSWSITAGVLNLLDTKPPFVPSTGGGGRGQQFGYDDRYYDPRGRTMYSNLSYKF